MRSETITYSLIPEIVLPAEAHSGYYEYAAGPQWRLAWPGGQGLARYLLDHSDQVSGRSALDLGCGGGVVSIAACMAGVRRLVATDTDEQALEACRENLACNGFTAPNRGIQFFRITDLMEFIPDAELLLIAEVLYTEGLRQTIIPWILERLGEGRTVLLGERVKEGLDALPLELAARYEVAGTNLGGRHKVYPVAVWRAGA